MGCESHSARAIDNCDSLCVYRKEEGFKKREKGLKKKDLELQESLIKFSKFLQENDAKRNRAEKKAIDERRLRTVKEGDIVMLKELLGELQAEKESTSTVVEKNMRYQKVKTTKVTKATKSIR